MSNRYGPRIVTDGLVLCLDAADRNSYPGTGTTWTDLSGNGYNGTLINGPTFNSSNKGSIKTDGTDDYISLANGDGLGNSFSSFSIDLTIKPQTGTGESAIGYILHRSTAVTIGASVYTISMNGNTLSFYINGLSASNLLQLSNRNNIMANYFYIWNGSVVSLYVNGVFNSSLNFSTFTNTIIGSSSTIGGTSLDQTFRPGNCDFFNIKIYNRALSATEVAQNYNATKGRFNL